MWFRDWSRLGTLVLAGIVAYASLVALLRISGKRTLAKLNAFDFVVTIALGSVLATVVVSREIPVAEGVGALALLIALQFVVAAASRRWNFAHQAVTSQPAALAVRGQVRNDELDRCRVTHDALEAAVRAAGLGSLADADCVVLETDGSLSVVTRAGDGSALAGVRGWGAPPPDRQPGRPAPTSAPE